MDCKGASSGCEDALSDCKGALLDSEGVSPDCGDAPSDSEGAAPDPGVGTLMGKVRRKECSEVISPRVPRRKNESELGLARSNARGRQSEHARAHVLPKLNCRVPA